MHRLGTFVGVILGLLFLALPAYAQIDRPPAQVLGGESVANFHFAGPGELTITVNLIGAVRSPGRYEISRSIDLMDLFSLAGGWTELADLADVHVSRLAGSPESGERKDLRMNLTDFQNISRSYLTLQHGDLIYIGSTSGVTLQDVLSWVTTAAILTTTYFTIIDRQR